MQRHAEISTTSGGPGRREASSEPVSDEGADEAAPGSGVGGGGSGRAGGGVGGGRGPGGPVSRDPGAGVEDATRREPDRHGVGSGGDVPPVNLPVALLAVTVNGRCRERSPADLALFGPDGERFVERFEDRTVGQALFARAVDHGTADGQAVLLTAAGGLRCRVSLWRQRGGERIRVVAAIAPETPEGGMGGDGGAGGGSSDGSGAARGRADLPAASEQASGPAWGRYPPLLSRSAGAVMDVLGALRGRASAAERLVLEDALAGLWRLMGLSGEMARRAALVAELPEGATPASMSLPGAGAMPSEVDLDRLVARLVRLATGTARRADVGLERAAAEEAPLWVVADAAALWSAVEMALEGAIDTVAEGGSVTVRIEQGARGGVCLRLIARAALPSALASGAASEDAGAGSGQASPRKEEVGPSVVAGSWARVAAYAATAGARLEVTLGEDGGHRISISLPERAVLWRS
ncbi:MAG: hypothetical protein AAF160_09315 [Pseudomonadota bacterium]